MPRLVNGGKYVFGWSVISQDGVVLIPEEARQEYKIEPGVRVILMTGSKTSGGFSIIRPSILKQSRLAEILTQNPDLAEFRIGEGEIIVIGGKSLCWTTIRERGQLQLRPDVMESYGVKPGEHLLVVRGSYIGIGMAAKGPLLEEAKIHPETAVFQTTC